MSEQLEKTIDGVCFSYNPLMAKQSREMLVQLTNKLGPVFGSGVKGMKGAGEFSLDDDMGTMVSALSDSFGSMIIEFSQAVNPGFYQNLVDTFLTRVSMEVEQEDGSTAMMALKAQVREIQFSRKLLLEAKVLLWCLEVQYSDFFDLWKSGTVSLGAQLATKTKSPSNFQKQSIGTSTESPQAADIKNP